MSHPFANRYSEYQLLKKSSRDETSPDGTPTKSSSPLSIMSGLTSMLSKSESTPISLNLKSVSHGMDEEKLRKKNVSQTEILLELHESIVAVAEHFEVNDPKFKMPSLNVDLDDMTSSCGIKNRRHTTCSVSGSSSSGKTSPSGSISASGTYGMRRQAKALIDFNQRDDDELGFKKNDIITILSERDEHCWIGMDNTGSKGWFPAKFVQLLHSELPPGVTSNASGDDPSDSDIQLYSAAGDDGVTPCINDLIRGRFCSIMKSILSHGLKKGSFLILHPWTVLDHVTSACIESDFNSVFSRLVLTKTYQLSELNRVLTPSELLYKNIMSIKSTHTNQPMDIKLRSLICICLNQRMLHEFWSVICSTQPLLMEKYYHESSYLRSPVWMLIRAELKLLSQFPFNLNPEAELISINSSSSTTPTDDQMPASPVTKDGVRDMLVKHHLFSWDLN